MTILDINQLLIQSLRSEEYKEYLPEIYSLHDVVENGKWYIQ